jgi:hypothetical protein
MEYQENFISTKVKKRFDDFVERVKTLGEKYYKAYEVDILEIITVKDHHIRFIDSMKVAMKRNWKYLYFTGDKLLQNSRVRILNVNNPDIRKLKKDHPLKKLSLDKYPFRLKINPANIDKKYFMVKENEDGVYENEYLTVEKFKFPEKKKVKVVIKRKNNLLDTNKQAIGGNKA